MNIVDLIPFNGKTAFLERKGYRTYPVAYLELKQRMLKTETYLKTKRVKKGDKILIQAPNSVAYVALMLACLRSGIIVVPLDLHTSPQLRKRIADEVKPKLIFTELGNFENIIKDLKENGSVPETFKEDIAEIVYTSGTTGVPKGVVLTHENIYSNVKALKESFGFRLKCISVLPLSHMLEQTVGLFLQLSNNSTILYPHSSRYSELIDLIRYKKINIMIAVPGILEGLKRAVELRGKSFARLLGWRFRIIGVGGADMPKELEKWWSRRTLLLQGYGLTETSPLITLNLPFRKKKYSIGKALKNVEIRIKDDEIQAKGLNVMKGYYKKPEKTKEVFDGEWFKTGDIGEIRNGYLYFKGRLKDIIATKSGLKAYPIDIETELNKYVKESCVIEKNGNIHAVLIIEKGEPKKIVEEVNKKLEAHQRIASFSIWHGQFPKTPTGKIKKFEVSKAVEHPILKQKNPLHSLLESALRTSIRHNVPLASVGMDSLKRMEILALIEEQYGIELNERDITPKTTAKGLENLIKKRKKISYYDFKLPKLHFLGEIIANLIMRIFCRIHYIKTEFKGIIAANHVSAFDVPVIASSVKTKYAVAALPYIIGVGTTSRYHKIRGFFIRHLLNTYPFGREVGLDNSLRFTAHLLDEGYSIMIFPEGGRTTDGKMHKFKEGIGFLAVNTDAEILPVKTEGLYKILPYNKFVPKFRHVEVKTGEQFKTGKVSYFKATELIEKRVRSL
jgi:long-chain acyl-CoA synthetase